MTADGEHQLTPEQREAIDSRDRDVFLRAGAGTGKTTVLVDRFCAAALDPDVGVDRILAFTFTERAADQLRRRVRERFAQLGREAEGERRERIEEAERAADRAWISTIHGFCRRVLASHPAAAGIDPRFRVADQVESDRLAGRAFDAALEDLVQAGGAEALELAAANRRRTLLEMTRGAYDELRSQGHPAPELPEPPPVDHAASLSALIETAGLAHEECAEAGPQQVSQRELIAAASALDPEAPADAELLDRLASLKITTTAKEFKGEACERYREALLAARSAVAATVLGPAYEQLRELVRRFGECYEALKADRSALDFEDLQLRARELLSSNEALRDRYREQFRHLMVDEFQDTNGLQLGLIEQLRGPQTRLFMVGDEFQSIYGFRHADVEVYRRQQRRFAQGEEPNGVALPLTGNFRSSGEVLAMTNALGRSLLAGFEPLTVAGEEAGAEGPAVELLLTAEDKKGWEAEETELKLLPDDPSSASKVAEARRLAGRLRELVDEGEDPSEIVVLLRAFTHVTTLERALGDAGLDPYVVGGRGFWSQQQVEDMRCLLAVIANPLDDQALFGALASPACAVLPDTLWLLRTGRHGGARGRPAEQPPCLAASARPGRARRGPARRHRRRRHDPARGAAAPARVRRADRHPAAARRRGRARVPGRAHGSRTAVRHRDPRSRQRRGAMGKRPQADAPRAGVRDEGGPGPGGLPRVSRQPRRQQRPRGRGRDAGRGPRRGKSHDRAQRQGVGVRGGRRGRPGAPPAARLDPASAGPDRGDPR